MKFKILLKYLHTEPLSHFILIMLQASLLKCVYTAMNEHVNAYKHSIRTKHTCVHTPTAIYLTLCGDP